MFLSLLLLVTQLWKLREFKIHGRNKLPDLIPDWVYADYAQK